MPKTLLRIAVLYALLGIGLGVAMAASHDFTNKGVHVHINLLGWVSMAVMALVYEVFPGMARSRLATMHVWLHTLGLPVMVFGIYMIMHQWPGAEPVVGGGSVVVALAFVCFALNAWLNAGKTVAQSAGSRGMGANTQGGTAMLSGLPGLAAVAAQSTN